ncbi:MAG: molybdopterin cofactor-binding domain-containing protein [Pseudomonadota bacterium]
MKPSDLSSTRRQFLKVSALGGAGFLIGCSESSAPPAKETAAAPSLLPPAADADLNAFIKVQADNTVTVVVKHLDKGQGVTTGLPAIVAEELDANWGQMRAEFAPADPSRYNNFAFGPVQGTGGSTSIANSWMQLRQAAAAARAMLAQAAAEAWGVPLEDIDITAGLVKAGDQQATFGELAALAAEVAPPAEPQLKAPEAFKLIGTDLPRLDSAAKTDGSARFTIDVAPEGAWVAVVAHPPRFGATVASVDSAAAEALEGVHRVVLIPRGVAVLADSYFTANKARSLLKIEWDFANAENRGSAEIEADFTALLGGPGLEARSDGDADGALDSGDRVLEQDFQFPFLAHATMEPMDCIVDLSPERCEIWTASQIPTLDQGTTAAITGLTPDKIVIHTQFAGGSFGRRAVPDSDFVAEAVMIAKAIEGAAPVKLQWSREDDMRGGRYRPIAVHRIRGAVSEDGKITAWHQRIASQSIIKGTAFEVMMTSELDPSVVEGSRQLPYDIPNIQVEAHQPETGVPVLWWRSVGHTHNAYVTEVFFDQLARVAGRDPYEMRRDMLANHPRHLAVLNRAAEAAGWGTDLGPNRGRGIAVHESFNSFVAEVAEVTVDNGKLKVDRIVCAVDCGIAITPDVVKAQMEGGIGYGLSAALREAVTLTNGEVDQGNFNAYQPLRINEMPDIEVHIVNSGEAPTGVGEPGTPPSAPAVANAIMDATGQVISRLPFGDQIA